MSMLHVTYTLLADRPRLAATSRVRLALAESNDCRIEHTLHAPEARYRFVVSIGFGIGAKRNDESKL